MENGHSAQVDFHAVLDALAERIAAKVCVHVEAARAVRPRLLNVREAAAYLGRSDKAIRSLAAQGAFPTVRADGRVQLDVNDLDRWIEQNKEGRAK